MKKLIMTTAIVLLGLVCLGQISNWVNPPKAQFTQTRAAQPTQPDSCSVAVFGTNGCKNLQQLQVDIENIRPCAEMSKRGMQAEADRCFKETREWERDNRDRIRFREGR